MYKIGIMGDSKTSGAGNLIKGSEAGVDHLLKIQYPATYHKFAAPSQNIAYMLTLWNALSDEDQQSFDYIFMEVGVNDFSPSISPVGTLMPKIQNLVTTLRNEGKSELKIVCNVFSPVKGNWDVTYTEEEVSQLVGDWDDMNEAMNGSGGYALTGADQIINDHIDIICENYALKDGYFNTSPLDMLHPNRAGMDIVADIWNKYLRGYNVS